MFFLLYQGPSKMAAKNSASEKALRDIIINRMLQSPKAQQLKASGDPAQQTTAEQRLYFLNNYIL